MRPLTPLNPPGATLIAGIYSTAGPNANNDQVRDLLQLLDRQVPEIPFILPLPDKPSAGLSWKILAC